LTNKILCAKIHFQDSYASAAQTVTVSAAK